mmetsp:Transcript_177/g.373  ORF Transcript_177/g.373 Transcript_177/m.373 type:complete len:156 (-) Transcript_177:142-609(-)
MPEDPDCKLGRVQNAGAVNGAVNMLWVVLPAVACAIISFPFAFDDSGWLAHPTITPTGLWLCHALQFAVMLTALTNLVQHQALVGRPLRRSGDRAAALLCLAIAAVLLMVRPTFFLLRDLKIIGPMHISSWGVGAARSGLALLLSSAAWLAARLP